MYALRLILWDQLSHTISSLEECSSSNDIIVMSELQDEATYVKHHKKKIAFLFSAIWHFAQELMSKGCKVEYTKLDDNHNAGSLKGEVEPALKKYKIDIIIVTHPGEYQVLKNIESWEKYLGTPVIIKPDHRFLCETKEFSL